MFFFPPAPIIPAQTHCKAQSVDIICRPVPSLPSFFLHPWTIIYLSPLLNHIYHVCNIAIAITRPSPPPSLSTVCPPSQTSANMALQAVYKQFLASPNSSVLAQNASLHYITTTTSYNGPTDIVKHFSSQRNHIRTKKENVLNVVEGQNTLAVQTELALEFLDNGGAYLPGLDDQFLSDRLVHIAVVSDAMHSALYCLPHRPFLAIN